MTSMVKTWTRGVGVFLAVAIGLCGQQTPVFRARSELVQVPVTVLGPDGHFLAGLTKDDFRLTVDGKFVKIANLDLLHAPTGAPHPLSPAAPGVYSNEEASRPAQRLVLLLDYDHTPLADLPNLRLRVKRWLREQMPAGEEVAIFALDGGLQVLEPFTSNKKELDAVIDGIVKFHFVGNRAASWHRDLQLLESFEADRLDPSQGPEAMGADPAVSDANQATANALRAETDLAAGPNAQHDFRETEQFLLKDQYATTMQALLHLADVLEGVPGRKPVIWLTTQTSLEVMWNPDAAVSSDARDVAFARLNQANVALFPLDIDGLGAITPFADASLRQLPPDTARNGGFTGKARELIGMHWVATWTGGKAFENTNGFEQVVDKVNAISSESYLLSFAPPAPRKGHVYRSVKVELTRRPRGTELLYRHQYLQPEVAEAQEQGTGILEQIRRLALEPIELGGVPVAVHAGTLGPAQAADPRSEMKPGTRIRRMDFALVVPYSSILHPDLRGGAGFGFDFTCFRILIPLDDPAHLLAFAPWRFRKLLSDGETPEWRNLAAVYRNHVDAPLGHLYLVRLVVRDNLSGLTGSVTFRIDTRSGAGNGASR